MNPQNLDNLDAILANIDAGVAAGMAAAKVKSTLARMDEIIEEVPLCMEYETDARDRWPQRWTALQDWLKSTNK